MVLFSVILFPEVLLVIETLLQVAAHLSIDHKGMDPWYPSLGYCKKNQPGYNAGAQNKVLHCITNAPWFKNKTRHHDLKSDILLRKQLREWQNSTSLTMRSSDCRMEPPAQRC